MVLKSKELCRRIRKADGETTYHVVSPEGKLRQVSESGYQDYEARATRTDALYTTSDSRFTRHYKTVYYV